MISYSNLIIQLQYNTVYIKLGHDSPQSGPGRSMCDSGFQGIPKTSPQTRAISQT